MPAKATGLPAALRLQEPTEPMLYCWKDLSEPGCGFLSLLDIDPGAWKQTLDRQEECWRVGMSWVLCNCPVWYFGESFCTENLLTWDPAIPQPGMNGEWRHLFSKGARRLF